MSHLDVALAEHLVGLDHGVDARPAASLNIRVHET